MACASKRLGLEVRPVRLDKGVVLSLFVCGLFPLHVAVAADEDKTYRLKNGRYWNSLPPESEGPYRLVFLTGILDGWELSEQTKEAILGKYIIVWDASGRFTTDELTVMITATYQQSENVNLPVGWVAMACLAVERGETTKDTIMLALRKHLAGLSGRTVYGHDADPVDIILKNHVTGGVKDKH
jgi:hypothetical protein